MSIGEKGPAGYHASCGLPRQLRRKELGEQILVIRLQFLHQRGDSTLGYAPTR